MVTTKLPDYYPPANRTAQARPHLAGGATFDHVEKLCLHTTETAGWPGYPTFAPHLTYNPWTHTWHQHYALTKSATTLADPSSTPVRENRDSVIQVEIVAYCDPKLAKTNGHFIDDIDDQAVRDLAEFAAWLHRYGLELALAPTWIAYAVSSRGGARNRFTSSQYDAFRGILGHEHASGNDHLDPGAPPWLATFLRYAKEAAGQSTTTPTPGKAALPMSDTTELELLSYAGNQPLPRGQETEVVINAKGDKTFAYASPGVDVLATLDVRDAAGRRYSGRIVYNPAFPTDPEAQKTTTAPQFLLAGQVSAFFAVSSYKEKTPTVRGVARKATTSDQVSYKGAIEDDKASGRSARLRLWISVPADAPDGLRLASLERSGWALEKD